MVLRFLVNSCHRGTFKPRPRYERGKYARTAGSPYLVWMEPFTKHQPAFTIEDIAGYNFDGLVKLFQAVYQRKCARGTCRICDSARLNETASDKRTMVVRDK